MVEAPPKWQLHAGDFLSSTGDIEPESVDVVLADPPYSSGARGDRTKSAADKYVQSGQKRTYEDFHGDRKEPWANYTWATAWMHRAYLLLKPHGYFLVFSDWRTLPITTSALQAAGFTWRGLIAWDKTEAARPPNRAYFRHQCEYIAWAVKGDVGRGQWALGPFPGCIREPSPRDKVHICQKPHALLKTLLGCCPSGGTVLDPFIGSGATGLAALDLGLKFIGCDSDPHWIDVASQRLTEKCPANACPPISATRTSRRCSASSAGTATA